MNPSLSNRVRRTPSAVRRDSLLFAAVLAFVAVFPSPARLAAQEPPEPPSPLGEILLVGTFHFVDAGLDSYRPEHDIDVLSPERQAQIEDLVERLAGFEPTKVAVEAMPAGQAELDERYRRYLVGEFDLPSNEIYQLGFRLARRAGLDGVHAVDAERRFYEPWVDPDEWALEHGQFDRLDPGWWAFYKRSHAHWDEAKTRRTLAEHLLAINDREAVLFNHGQYLIGNFEVGDDSTYPGVDAKTAWFNRNLRIFANLQRLVASPGERIVLVIGSGHLAILRHSIEASPQYRLVELRDLLEVGSGE